MSLKFGGFNRYSRSCACHLSAPQTTTEQQSPKLQKQKKIAEKPFRNAVFLRKMIWVRRLAPWTSSSPSRRATNCTTPRYEIVKLPGCILSQKHMGCSGTPSHSGSLHQSVLLIGTLQTFDLFHTLTISKSYILSGTTLCYFNLL